jgi:hypothetical protein
VGATGWMPDDILNRLTWQDFVDLTAYWKDHPPLQWMVQAYLGIGKKEEAPSYKDVVKEGSGNDGSAFRALVDSLNSG